MTRLTNFVIRVVHCSFGFILMGFNMWLLLLPNSNYLKCDVTVPFTSYVVTQYNCVITPIKVWEYVKHQLIFGAISSFFFIFWGEVYFYWWGLYFGN